MKKKRSMGSLSPNRPKEPSTNLIGLINKKAKLKVEMTTSIESEIEIMDQQKQAQKMLREQLERMI